MQQKRTDRMTGTKKAKALAPAPSDLQQRLAAVHEAQDAATKVLAELKSRAEDALTADQLAAIQPDIEVARNIIDDCKQKIIDLTAATTTLQPLDPALAARMQQLAVQIDAATQRSALANATLDGLAAVLNSAIRIKAIV